MNMETWCRMLEAIRNEEPCKIPAQLHLRGQIDKLANAFGSIGALYEYFGMVERAEDPIIETLT